MKMLLMLVLVVLPCLVNAEAKEAFSEQAFIQAQKSNQLILIDIYADWCPTCQKQLKILTHYFKQHKDSRIRELVVNFDTQKDWVTFFKAPRQSTLILYQGRKQLWFSVAETDEEKIVNALNQAELQQ